MVYCLMAKSHYLNQCWLIIKGVLWNSSESIFTRSELKGAVSYRFLQGLLTLMCNNSKLKADINFFFFLLRRQTSKVYNWLQKFTIQHFVIAFGAKLTFFIILDSTPKLHYLFHFFFLIMIHICLLPKTVSAFANWSFVFGNVLYFV